MKHFTLLPFLFVTVLGLDLKIDPTKFLSKLGITTDILSGPWYLLYWGAPTDFSLYPKNMKCNLLWGGKFNGTHIKVSEKMYISDGKVIERNEEYVTITRKKDKFLYEIRLGDQSLPIILTYFDKYKYSAGYAFDGVKKYLIAFGRSPTALTDCDEYRLNKWLKGTTQNKNTPSYKINPADCECLN